MTFHAKRGIACIAACGLLLAACGSTATSQNASRNQRQLEAAACKLIGATPTPSLSYSEAISVRTSTLKALQQTDDAPLRSAVSDYENAANAQDENAMIRALNNAVKVCHGLGLKTASI